MHNIHELEQRWFKYKLRSYMPHFITLVFSAVLAITLILIVDTKQSHSPALTAQEDKNIVENVQKKVETKQMQVPMQEVAVNNQPTQNIVQDTPQNKLTLAPSLDFMKKIGTNSINTYEHKNNKISSNNTQKKQYKSKQVEKKEVAKSKPVYKHQARPKTQKINISTRQTQNDIKNVIKRFKKNNNPALSLFIAKKYYKLGNYEKAYNYALITNSINNEIEQSWIIFAKSLVKLKKKDLAIRTLTKYVKHSHSGNAKVLLDDIKAGKFR